MAEKEIQKYSAEYLAEQKKKEEADRLTNEKYYKVADHKTERTREIEKEENSEYPEKLFYEFFPTCNGNIKVQLSGIFGRHFIVQENGPEYKSVDNILRYLVFTGPGEYTSATQHRPYSLLRADNSNGDKYRNQIFEAYENALKILKYCRENDITVLRFVYKCNPEYLTLYDYEVKKFFKDLQK